MILKVLYIESTSLTRNRMEASKILEGRIISEEIFDSKKYYVFKMFVKSSAESLGVLNDKGSLAPLKDYLNEENMQLLKCRFVVVDILCKLVYYDGNMDDIKDLLLELFDIPHQKILINVSVDDFTYMKKLKIRTIMNGQMSSNDVENKYEYKSDLINDLCISDGSVESSTYELILKGKGSLFNLDKFKEVVDDHNSGLRVITAEGYDKDGRQVKLSSQIVKKVSILENESSWQSRLDLSLIDVLTALLKEVKK